MDEDWKKKKNWSSRPSVDDWQGLHNISWINNGEKKLLKKKLWIKYEVFIFSLKNKLSKQNKNFPGSGMFCTNQHLTPTRHCFFFQEQKQNLILWRCGEKSWPVQLIIGSRSRHQLKLIHNVVELHSGLEKKLKSNLETSLKKKASTISW